MNPADLHATIEERLRADGQRYTGKRRSIVEAIEDAGKPLPMPELLAACEGLPQSSVYRNLAVLENAGVVRRVITEDEFARFELTEELAGHHHHLVCSRCGRVEDVTVPSDLEAVMDDVLDRLGRRSGFAEVGHRLDLIGVCADCAG